MKAPFPYLLIDNHVNMEYDTKQGGLMNKDTIARFWMKVEKTETCWIWKASKRAKGYGAFVWADKNGKIVQGGAHRFSWELKYGEIQDNLCVLHKCDIPSCVNPDHLFLGTRAENNIDMRNKGRARSGSSKTPASICKYKRGTDHHACRFTNDEVLEIRNKKKSGLSYGKLAKEYNTGVGYVWKICNGRLRKDVK